MNKEIIKQYIKKADNKLHAANIEFDDELYEECIGCAYYAMYHASKALLLTKELTPKKHAGVITKLGEEFLNIGMLDQDDIKNVSWGLERRIKADYDPLIEMDRVEASEALTRAEDYINKIKKVIDKIM